MKPLLRFSKIHREYPIKRLTSINREGDEPILPTGKTREILSTTKSVLALSYFSSFIWTVVKHTQDLSLHVSHRPYLSSHHSASSTAFSSSSFGTVLPFAFFALATGPLDFATSSSSPLAPPSTSSSSSSSPGAAAGSSSSSPSSSGSSSSPTSSGASVLVVFRFLAAGGAEAESVQEDAERSS